MTARRLEPANRLDASNPPVAIETRGHKSDPGPQPPASPGLDDRTEAELDARAVRLSQTLERITGRSK
jgi:hypothetical protein